MPSNDFVIPSSKTKRKVAQINKKKTQFLCKLQAKENFLLFCSFTSLNYCKYISLYHFVLFIFKLKYPSTLEREEHTITKQTKNKIPLLCFPMHISILFHLYYCSHKLFSSRRFFRRYKRKLELSTIGLSCLSNSKYKCRTWFWMKFEQVFRQFFLG